MKRIIIKKFFPIVFLLFTVPVFCQPVKINRDKNISEMINDISIENLKSNIEKLVSFKTRHTLSSTTNETEGIGAARRWVKSEFDKYSAASGGRLTASFDPFIVMADGRRINRNVELKNVIATLKGTDPNDNRIFIVGGHIDSRVNDVMDSTSIAPGADDDGSPHEADIESSTVMRQRPKKFRAARRACS